MKPILSALMLDTHDRCERRFAFERDWASRAISPLSLLYRALEGSLNSPDPEETAKSLALRIASKSELQVNGLDAFTVTRHVGFLAGILSLALREKLGLLEKLPTLDLPEMEWIPNVYQDEKGNNHRIVLLDHLDDDRLRAEAHSWATIGELVTLEKPLFLTALLIGAHRGSRRHSAWTKGSLHPKNHSLKFGRRQQKGSGLQGAWEDVWRENRPEISTANWLRVMKGDGVLEQLIVSRLIPYRADDLRMTTAREEMKEILQRMERASEKSPMRRTSCDATGRGTCPFSNVCWSPILTSPEQLSNIYRPK